MSIVRQDYGSIYDPHAESLIAPIQKTLVADRAYAVGDCFILDGVMYRMTQAVLQGATIVIGTDCEVAPPVTDMIDQIYNATSVNAQSGVAVKEGILEGKVNQVQFQTEYGANNGTPINIDQIDIRTAYIYKLQHGNTFSGTWPTKIDAGSCILAGYSFIINGNPMFGVQLAFGVTNGDKNYIAMRTNSYSASGKTWNAWKYIELTTT